MQVSIAEAKSKFADLIRRVEAGEDIEVTRYGRPVARLVATAPGRAGGLVGCMEGAFEVPDEDDSAATDAEIAEMFLAAAGRSEG
ncbi:hypothetical protein JANAI62_37020 [Jannaschia pagri]|uniref:Antitoxin n=1 Tax=Jannaschia pagri TaxID=2829797 RepID=A0ABQ4NS49_9RHOB|nr:MULTISPECIES: type II toxin-antitoxin system prevent-host-death family antitoxin [unclassified Jannaschia]GIT93254.1 hypothetical protein JANAI61_37120 [Jannaschia sp. AI_61]GIT97079.1 hypothetical protein JANAI62_37020 [Jannaschia sp. AI_62]